MKKPLPKPSRKFHKFLKVTLGNYLIRKFNIKADTGGLEKVDPPYIVIANHPGFWDPFILSAFAPHPIQYVASDTYFRKPLLRILLRLVGAFPKSKFMADAITVKTILHVKKQGGVIGIFPEGSREWDGRTEELLYPTAKLIKSLKIPVISAKFNGGFLSHPRWASKPRKGELNIEYRILFEGQSAESHTVDEVYDKITKALQHDEYEYQAKKMIRFKGRKLAERLGLFLFICPECRSIGKLESRDDTFTCSHCGYSVRYNEFGFLDPVKVKTLYYDTPAKWNTWQLEYLNTYISDKGEGETIIFNNNVILKKGYKYTPTKTFRFGSIELVKGCLNFKSRVREEYSFPLNKITGLNVQYNDLFEFYYEGTLYQFNFKLANDSAYKWIKAIKAAV